MVFGREPDPIAAKALDTYWVTVIDHDMNASTFTSRVIASTRSDMVSAVTGAIGAMKGIASKANHRCPQQHQGLPGSHLAGRPVVLAVVYSRDQELYGNPHAPDGPLGGSPACYLETFLLVNRVRGLPPGLYHYAPFKHALQGRVISNTIADEVVAASLQQEFIKESAVAFLWVAIADRMIWRYTERGFRYLFLDAGHVCQNLYLAAESVGCGACAIGAFDDDRINELLGLDGKHEFVIYMAAVGKKP